MKWKIYNSSDFDLKIIQASDFEEKCFFFKMRDFEDNNIFKKVVFEEKINFEKQILRIKFFLENRFWKNNAHKQIRFWYLLPRKMHNFCV